MTSPESIVERFNDAISAHDITALGALMSDDHVFVDSVGGRVDDHAACIEAWRSFFAAFPDYRNVFDRIEATAGTVVALGRSECQSPELDGPALWRAIVVDAAVREWRVYDDTPENRRELGVAGSPGGSTS